MVQSLQLGTPNQSADDKGMKRLNRVPLFVGIGILVLFLAVLVYGLSSRGLRFGQHDPNDAGSVTPASTFADQLKRGVKDGIIGDREEQQPAFQPTPVPQQQEAARPAEAQPKVEPREPRSSRMESDEEWNARMLREQREQIFREQQRQRMASLQARGAALDSPLKVDITDVTAQGSGAASAALRQSNSAPSGAQDLYAAALRAGAAGQVDQNGQASKEDFFNADIKDLGYLPNQVVPQQSRYELKRGSVIPATLITGINSDLPGRITAQVSQNVYDSATGHFMLVPQGTKLFGRYDSKVSFSQNRALVVWTDIIFPNGSTLQIGGMAGTDSEGYGGFSDKVDNHYLRTFGSAALVALIGTGIDMSMPQSSTLATQDTASDAARRNFAETFGRVAEQTISKNLIVQPTIKIRPGFRFNVLVDQDIIFPGNYSN
ncbi:type IV secretion system protein VirB10 [Rhizobium tibeticum]|uniref:Pertussis toxin liberation protein G n=1 Tax=Rhizobium tibeticum TaxID=501024 RepID=A0A1H8WST4_9HYPH|nr:IncP-type conjugal transfer protein TrbI [Rhizobium tibeticum]SEI19308.1 Pertussis toxin liberation protein G [Rhizobium tibeticum]SEP30507.1 type IV secretion system protein VirB10 [Rhizobium tibeticum]